MFQLNGKQIKDNSIILSGTNGVDNIVYINGDYTLGSHGILTQKEISDFIYSKEFISKEYADLFYSKFTEFTSGYYYQPTDIIYNDEVSSSSGLMNSVIPANYRISGITIQELEGGGGNLYLGSTSGGNDILYAVVNPYDVFDCTISTFNIQNGFYSLNVDTPIYITLDNWSIGQVKIYFTFQRVSGVDDRETLIYSQETALSTSGQLTDPIPYGYKVDGIVIEETGGGGGNLSLGSSSGANNILSDVVVNPFDLFDCNISTYNIGKSLFSLNTNTPIYLTLTSWTGTVNIYFTYLKV